MNIEEKIDDCEFNLKQLNYFQPDPFYVKNFFRDYLISVNNFYRGIFEEVNRDFGLFVKKECNKESIKKKAIEKNDLKALEFVEWFEEKYEELHQDIYPNFIMWVRNFFNTYSKIPPIKIMIRAKERFEDDVLQEIKVNLSNNRLISKDNLVIEIKRQLPIFLEICNKKRTRCHEPIIDKTQVVAVSCMNTNNCQNIEISYAAEIYITMIKRLLTEYRAKIKDLVSWSS